MTSEEKEKVIEKWKQFSQDHDVIMQISYPRSGRHWLKGLMRRMSGGKPISPMLRESRLDEDLSKYLYVVGHQIWVMREMGDNIRYIIIVRDPRDAFLSWAYFQNIDRDADRMSSKFVSRKIENGVKRWGRMLELSSQAEGTVFIQYEQLCLWPLVTLKRVVDFIGFTPVKSKERAVEIMDRKVEIGKEETDTGETVLTHDKEKTKFETNLDRYNHHSLKWQRDDFFLFEHNELVYDKLGDVMEKWGYTKEGHDLSIIKKDKNGEFWEGYSW